MLFPRCICKRNSPQMWKMHKLSLILIIHLRIQVRYLFWVLKSFSFHSPFLFLPHHHICLLKGSNHPPTHWLVRKDLRCNIKIDFFFFFSPYKVQYTLSTPLLFSIQSRVSWAVNEKLTQDQDFSKYKIQSCPSNISIHWETMTWMNHCSFHRRFCPHMSQ